MVRQYIALVWKKRNPDDRYWFKRTDRDDAVALAKTYAADGYGVELYSWLPGDLHVKIEIF